MSTTATDPREIITPDAFSVAPELLGTPLARPWRRAVAMAVDMLLVIILGSAGWFFLGLALAILSFRAAFRRSTGLLGRGARLATFGSLGVIILIATIAPASTNLFFGDGEPPVRLDTGNVIAGMGLGETGAAVADALALSRAESEEEMREAATRFAERLRQQGLDPAEIREMLEDISAGSEAPWAEAVIASIVDTLHVSRVKAGPDSLARAYTAALESGDSAQLAGLGASLGEALAADRLARQQRRIERLQEENQELEGQLDEEQNRGLIQLFFKVADEIGIGFGWAGLYFTLFLAFWKGRTPGKRLVGIRVVRLDGKPIGLWAAFNRFGGYAASIFTGLLGFFEMFWDRNRQALHDRIAATVVVRGKG
jgi:DNA-binding transcriptional MerR regulator